MPQMAPMNWLLLMFYFSFIFILMNTLNYYSFNYEASPMQKKNYIKFNSFNWKW